MGTRHITVVILNDEFKVAQYGQWDGYPSGQGSNILSFLRSADLQRFKQAVSECSFLSHDEILDKWEECGADRNSQWVSFEVSNKVKELYPELSRDVGSDILKLVLNGKRHLQNSLDFAKSSLWCEWAYVIDLDKNVLEVYEGFNKTPLTESDRFYDKDFVPEDEYYPIKLSKSFDINNLPSDEDFEKSFEDDEE